MRIEKALTILNENLLDQKYITCIKKQSNPEKTAEMINILDSKGLLTSKNLDWTLKYNVISEENFGLSLINGLSLSVSLFSNRYVKILALLIDDADLAVKWSEWNKDLNRSTIHEVLTLLNDADLVNQENIECLQKNPCTESDKIERVASFLTSLSKNEQLNQENFDKLFKARDIKSMQTALDQIIKGSKNVQNVSMLFPENEGAKRDLDAEQSTSVQAHEHEHEGRCTIKLNI